MDLRDGLSNLRNVPCDDDFVENDGSSYRYEAVIATRLRRATNPSIDREASTAWNERRIIRTRLQYYASAH